jgi:hypothetical protein
MGDALGYTWFDPKHVSCRKQDAKNESFLLFLIFGVWTGVIRDPGLNTVKVETEHQNTD